MNPSKSEFLEFHQITGIPGWIYLIFIGFVTDVGVRVYLEIKKDQRK